MKQEAKEMTWTSSSTCVTNDQKDWYYRRDLLHKLKKEEIRDQKMQEKEWTYLVQ